MELEKIRNLGSDELKHEEQQASEQLFRLRFQMRLGQTEGVKRLRGLKKDVARMKTIARERELGLVVASHAGAQTEAAKPKQPAKKAAEKAPAVKKTVAKKAGKAAESKSAAKPKTAKQKTEKKEAR